MLKPFIYSLAAMIRLSNPFVNAGEATLPKAHFSYNSLFDSICEKQTGYSIEEGQKSELKEVFPTLIEDWNMRGARLLQATQEVVGKPFTRQEFDVTLSLCSFPSMSHPLIINMRHSLRSFTAQPVSMVVSLSVVHHEILHHYVTGLTSHNSALLRKYASEDSRVKAHLHLLAVQEAAFLHLGWEKELAEVIKKDEALTPGHYKRAWQIIKAEGSKAFLDELKKETQLLS